MGLDFFVRPVLASLSKSVVFGVVVVSGPLCRGPDEIGMYGSLLGYSELVKQLHSLRLFSSARITVAYGLSRESYLIPMDIISGFSSIVGGVR